MKRKEAWARLLANALTLSMTAGLCAPAATVFAANEAAIVEEAAEVQEQAEAVESGQYVLMNIPYDEFYKAEVGNNTVPVDAFTSATLNKTRTKSLVGGSYHVDPNGTDITGITYPVKIGEGVDLSGYKQVTDSNLVTITVTNRGQTSTQTYEGRDALFENASYSYYVLGSGEEPAYYKEVTSADGRLSFGPAVGARTEKTGVTAEFTTESGYGDHQLNLDGLGLADDAVVYAVVVKTDDGMGYGLRHMENIWRQTALSWCTGFTPSVHNCPTSSEHYKSMMGKTIKEVVYYTDAGIIEIPMEGNGIYVPEKFTHTLEVADAAAASGSTTMTLTGLPADYDAQYSVDGLAVQASGDRLTFTGAQKGRYTLEIKDAGGRYAPLSTTFILYTEDMPAAYNAVRKALVAASGSDASALADYLQNITAVSVDGESYAASGRGAVAIINEDGTVKTDAAPLEGKATCTMEITSTGYLPLTFTYSTAAVDTAALQRSIQAAEKLQKSAYTAASYAKVTSALKTAKSVLAIPGSQAEADQAAKQLDAAVRALVKARPARPKTGTVTTYAGVRYQVLNASTVRVQKAASTAVKTVKIPATITINGYKYQVTAVANKAFADCRRLKTVQITANVTSIGASAFQGCTALTSFTASSAKLASIGKNAFSGDKKLAAISLKTAKLTKAKVGANAFKNIKNTCTFRVPAKKTAAYKTIFTAKGAGKKIRVKKL